MVILTNECPQYNRSIFWTPGEAARSASSTSQSIDFLDAGGSRSASSFVSESVCAFHGGPPRDRWSCFLPVVLVAPVLEVVRNVHNGAAAVRLLLNVLLHFQVSSRD